MPVPVSVPEMLANVTSGDDNAPLGVLDAHDERKSGVVRW
jgi:hypothetical protein